MNACLGWRQCVGLASFCLLFACGRETEDAPLEVIEVEEEELAALDEDVDEEPEDSFIDENLPAPREVRLGEGGATVHREAAVIVAGEMRLEVRPNSLKEPAVVQIRTKRLEEFETELPSGMLLASASGSPRDAGFLPVSRWHIPLDYTMEPGTTLEVLSWHPQLLTWMNAGDANVNAAGTHAVFFTMVMGDVILRKKPVRDPQMAEICPGVNFRLREEWPGKEAMTVGLTPETERVSREDAFRYMTDFRLSPVFPSVSFKNEEVILGAWHRNAVAGRSYVDEDYLMDPNGAAALTLLQDFVAREWIDPYTGEPASRVRLTEAYDSMIEHSQPSTHYQGRGLDLTLDPVPPPGTVPRRAYYGRLARLSVCAGFDYVLFEDNFHVHASIHPTKVASLVQGDDGRYGVLVGNLWDPNRWELLSHRWSDDDFLARELAWTGWNTIEVRGDEDDALYLHAENERPRQEARSDFQAIRSTLVGTQELRAVAGELYLVNRHGAPVLGAFNDDEKTLPVTTPVQFPLEEWTVLDAAMRPHSKTRNAWSTMSDPPLRGPLEHASNE